MQEGVLDGEDDEQPFDFDMEVCFSLYCININSPYVKIIDSNIRHDAVPVPSSRSPFNAQQLAVFEEGLNLLTESGDLPAGYGVDEDVFDEHQDIHFGLRRRGHNIQLSRQIWQPRTELWAQGLFAMNTILSYNSP